MADDVWLSYPANENPIWAESAESQFYKLSLFFINFMA